MAPTVFRIWGFRVMIYPRDHEPPHVHIVGPGAEAKFVIDTLECTESWGFSEKSLNRIKEYLLERQSALQEAWDEYQK